MPFFLSMMAQSKKKESLIVYGFFSALQLNMGLHIKKSLHKLAVQYVVMAI